MPNPEIAITIHSPPDSPTSTSSFELVHPTHTSSNWKPSNRQEELPYYMAEDTSTRRRVTHHPAGAPAPQHDKDWADEYDGERKDVYAKVNAFPRYGGGGRVARRAPLPPPTSFVCFALSSNVLGAHRSFLLLLYSASSSSKTSSTSSLQYIPSCRAGHGSTKSASRLSSSGTRRTLASSAHTTSSASFISMSIHPSGKCSSGSQGYCLDTTAASNSRAARPTPTMCPMLPCASSWPPLAF